MLRDHLDVCRDCCRELEAERELQSALGGAVSVTTFEADLATVEADIQERNAVSPALFMALAALAIVVTVGAARGYDRLTTPTPRPVATAPEPDAFRDALARHRSATVLPDPTAGIPVVSVAWRGR